MTRTPPATSALLLLLAACGGAPESSRPIEPLGGPVPPMPRLIFEQAWAAPLDVHYVKFGMGSGPSFLVRTRQGGSHAVAWVGPTRAPLYFAGVGDGPGEVRSADVMVVDDSTLAVYDFSNNRIAWWDTTGTFLRQVALREVLLQFGPGRQGEWIAGSMGPEGVLPVSLDLATGRSRRLVMGQDSFIVAEFGELDGGEPRLGSSGLWDGGFLSVRGQTYRIAGYDWDGRRRFVIAPDLPPNLPGPERLDVVMEEWRRSGRPGRLSESARREYFAERPEQFFSHLGPPRLDAAGRLWVVGRDAPSGRLFADAWWRDSMLVREWLECQNADGRWNLSRERLALVCDPEPGDSINDRVYRIWRIEDAVPEL